jgi:hypothetical protein
MDHLSSLRSETEQIRVPYLCVEPYDFKGFAGFPFRKEFNVVDMLEKGDFRGRNQPEVEAFLQAWLYFGLLGDVLQIGLGVQIDIRVREYVSS